METLKILIFWISFIIVVLGINCFIIPVLVNLIISLVGRLFKWEFIKGFIKDVKEDNYVVLEKKVNFQYFKFEFVGKWNVIID